MLTNFDNLIMVGYEMRDIDGIFRMWLIDMHGLLTYMFLWISEKGAWHFI